MRNLNKIKLTFRYLKRMGVQNIIPYPRVTIIQVPIWVPIFYRYLTATINSDFFNLL